MKQNIKSILTVFLVVVVAVVVLKTFDNRKTILENKNSTSDPTDFINTSATEMSGDRVDPSNKGVVTGTLEPICQSAENNGFKCYENYYENLVITKGIPVAFADIKIRENQNSYVKSQCHPLAHSIGHAGATLYPEILDAFANGDSYCWSGYYHGILEEIIEQMGKEKTLSALNTICSRVSGKEVFSFDYYNCVHGLGHGLMATAGQQLFDALKMCDNLTGSWEKSSCYSGVFMENVIIENKGGTTKYLKPAEPVYPCNAVGNNYKQVCYLMQTSYMLKVSGNNFATVFDLCSKVENPYQTTCYQSLGRDASGQSSSNVEQTKITCNLGINYEQKSNCVVGAVKDFISYYHSNTEAVQFCNALDNELKNLCLSTGENYYRSL